MDSENTMKIDTEPFRDSNLPDVVRMYNGLAETIPFNWPVTTAEFRDEVIGGGALLNPAVPFHSEELFLARVDGEARGFVHFGTVEETGEQKTERIGFIRFLVFPRPSPDVGQKLLKRALASLKERDIREVQAWRMYEGYPFYISRHGGCWEDSYLADFFLRNRFEVCRREIVFVRPVDFVVDIKAPDIPFDCERKPERNGSGVVSCLYSIRAGSEDIASCEWHRMNVVSRHPDAMNYGYIYSIGTSGSHRRLGLGQYMIGLMMEDMAVNGIREVALHTLSDNLPAIGLYTKMGFRQSGNCIVFRTPSANVSP